LSLGADVFEKDYVLGWLLAGIYAHPELSLAWVFKNIGDWDPALRSVVSTAKANRHPIFTELREVVATPSSGTANLQPG
jgi:hypothetical protein